MIGRRLFLRCAAGAALASLSCTPGNLSTRRRSAVRFGIVTDCHYADADPVGTRFYRESLGKLAECVDRMNTEKVDFLVELGDFKDENRPPVEEKTLAYLHKVETVFRRFHGRRYHVLGNHDMDSTSKQQFLRRVENTGIEADRSYYSFDAEGLHCIVLDANYRSDGSDYDHGNFDWTDANIPACELDWLRQDLAASGGPAAVFSHQMLDGTGAVYVKNAAAVRQILAASGKVLAVFQGHHHPGAYSHIHGIHYYTLKGMIEGRGEDNDSYAVVKVQPNRNITVTGYRKASSLELSRVTKARKWKDLVRNSAVDASFMPLWAHYKHASP
ncbi:MAG: metallophosphoesterase [Planctomycetes bacterium]|nr:metallophosphoesterase [Planctomycetota bacterium]